MKRVRVCAAWAGRTLAVAVVASVAFVPLAVPVASQTVPPVDGPVVDGYRPPIHIGAPGNRGWEYLVSEPSPVRAARAGSVAFAGVIAGRLYVSIQHSGWLRTTYSYLDTIGVVAGQRVVAGEVLGTVSGSFHFGARRNGAYVDPATLFVMPRTPAVLIARH
ncbi:MAG: murein hydrolase activator EnvC family protein [Acidimicrobiales bacterium]